MESVNLTDARERLDELVKRAAAGEEIIISDAVAGEVRLLPISGVVHLSEGKRIPGRWKGRIHIPDDALLAPLTDEELSWMTGEN